MSVGPAATAMGWPNPGQQTVAHGPPGGASASSGVRRVPVILANGRQQQRAWLVLRDCHVEEDPNRRGVPSLQIHGLDVAALAGAEPEIQIRNARIRM